MESILDFYKNYSKEHVVETGIWIIEGILILFTVAGYKIGIMDAALYNITVFFIFFIALVCIVFPLTIFPLMHMRRLKKAPLFLAMAEEVWKTGVRAEKFPNIVFGKEAITAVTKEEIVYVSYEQIKRVQNKKKGLLLSDAKRTYWIPLYQWRNRQEYKAAKYELFIAIQNKVFNNEETRKREETWEWIKEIAFQDMKLKSSSSKGGKSDCPLCHGTGMIKKVNNSFLMIRTECPACKKGRKKSSTKFDNIK